MYAQDIEVQDTHIRTVQLVANEDIYAPPIIRLGSDESVELSFDELSHEYRRYVYVVTHCNADGTPSRLAESQYLEGFNGNPIEDYAVSLNTTMPYTHYRVSLPNEEVRFKLSGNYRISVYDDDAEDETPAFTANFQIIDKQVSVSAQVSTNTDIDTNHAHQQVSFNVNHKGYPIRNPQSEVKVLVMQNNRTDNRVTGILPSYIGNGELRYEHNRSLIFPAGHEYRRFETVSIRRANMHVESLRYHDPYYHATLQTDDLRTRNYVYDQDQDGHYLVRYDEGTDQDTEADYFFVHFSLACDRPLSGGELYLQGEFTHNRFDEATRMSYNHETHAYENTQLLKQGAYNYQYLYVAPGTACGLTRQTEGDYHETENEYLILMYHRAFGERYDKLVGMQQVRTAP